jgi:F-type H+-transporting ATP synthase subunit e
LGLRLKTGLRDKSPNTSTRLYSGIGPANDARAQVLRYSALGLGVFYGFYHQRTISSSQKAAAAQREYEHKQELINKAKEAYAKTKQPASSKPAASEGEFSQRSSTGAC